MRRRWLSKATFRHREEVFVARERAVDVTDVLWIAMLLLVVMTMAARP